MVEFNLRETEVFQFASFIRLWDSLLIVLIRLGLLALTLLAAIFGLRPILGIFFLFLIFELFYLFKVKKFQPKEKISEIGESENLAKVLSLESAIAVLQSENSTQLLKFLVETDFGQEFLARAGIDRTFFEKFSLEEDIDFASIIGKAFNLAKQTNKSLVSPLEFLVACFVTFPQLQKISFDNDLKEEDLVSISFWVEELERERRKPIFVLNKEVIGAGIAQNWTSGYTLETEKYTQDVTKKMTKGELKPYLVGREKEISDIEEVLARDRKKNVILVGEAGVGKSAVVFALAKKSFEGGVLQPLRYRRVLELNLGALLAGGIQGELESRVVKILEEVEHAGDVILYIPNIENIVGAAEVNLSGLFLSALGGDKVQVIATTSQKNYVDFIEAVPEFAENFDKVVISEPNLYDSVKICQQAATKIEKTKGVTISYKAVLAAVKYSDRYMKDRVLPGKAIDLLDQVAVKVASAQKQQVLEDDLVKLISEKKGIPLKQALGKESERLLNLEKILHNRVVDQNEAIEAIAKSLRRARALIREEKRPIGSFLFLGPTGVGKTETARALAESYFGGEDEMIRLDMSEFQTPDSVGRLIGQTGEKGQLTEKVRAKPFSLILLDEMEKANKNVLQLFLQVFDEGRLTDATGITVDFTQTIIIATSNAGAEVIREKIVSGANLADFKEEFIDQLFEKGVFSPEFLNRFTEIVLFRPLTHEELLQVTQLLINKLSKILSQQEIEIETAPALLSYLVKEGFDQVFGARPLRRLIENEIEGAIAKKILEGEVKRGEKIFVDVDSTGVIFKKAVS